MCGILFCLCSGSGAEDKIGGFLNQCQDLVKRRGPDSQAECRLEAESVISCYSSVLWLQGQEMAKQPVVTGDYIFQWNGDAYAFAGQCLDSRHSDTLFMAEQLARCFQTAEEEEEISDLLHCLEQVQGPWAFVFWHKHRRILWFGRDFFGRQSLLLHRGSSTILLASCAPVDPEIKLREVAANGMYRLEGGQLQLFPWNVTDPTAMESIMDDDIHVSSKTLSCPVNIASIGKSSHITLPRELQKDRVMDQLLDDPRIRELVDRLVDRLKEAVRIRVENQPGRCKHCIKDESECVHPSLAILFSGGLDSTLLAFMAGQLLGSRPIDLLNVAFQLQDGSFSVPDRQTGMQAYQELNALLPSCRFNLVSVNVSLAELQRVRYEHVRHLLHPLNTVLDDSIGCAVWFAARGQGELVDGEEYQSPARVLLAGMGIDEQLGGYSRHRVRYQKEGLTGLEQELRMELLRISERNLGRDNRMMSDHGVMARFPYLDENLVNFLCQLDTEIKCCMAYPRGIGEKLILRLAAHQLGLRLTAREPKRAVQFGSRIAKMENRKEKASDIALRD